jgi:hypothetical protein
MAASHPSWLTRVTSSKRKIGPVFAQVPVASRRRRESGVTAGRTRGVGAPTSEPDLPVAPAPVDPRVAEAVLAALASLDVLTHHAGEIAQSFRRHQLADAQRGLALLIRSTETMVRLAIAAATVTGTELAEFCGDDRLQADEETGRAVDQLISYQFAGDWAALAAVLDGDFVSALRTWRQVFEALLGFPVGPGPLPYAA